MFKFSALFVVAVVACAAYANAQGEGEGGLAGAVPLTPQQIASRASLVMAETAMQGCTARLDAATLGRDAADALALADLLQRVGNTAAAAGGPPPAGGGAPPAGGGTPP